MKRLIVQGSNAVMVAIGQVPVIPIYPREEWKLAWVVNFLRSGCPSVQLLMTEHPEKGAMVTNVVRDSIGALSLPGELFHVAPDRDELDPHQLHVGNLAPLVFTITREVT